MKVKDALQRIGFTISKQNKPNSTDAEAFNKILWFMNQSIEHNPNKNILFAKLYLYQYRTLYQIYGDEKIVQTKLHTILDLPIDYHYKQVQDTVNTYELRKYLDDKGIKSTHFECLDFESRKKIQEEIKENAKKIDIEEFCQQVESYDYQTTVDAMNALITLALKTYTDKS
jgi:hypothetical protein